MQVDLISRAYAYVLQALNNRALLPENLWGSLSVEQQSMLVLLRNTALEPLLETVGEPRFSHLLPLRLLSQCQTVSGSPELHFLTDVSVHPAQMMA